MPDITNLGNDIEATPKLAILIKANAANIDEVKRNYADYINLPLKEILFVKLPAYTKFKVSDAKAELLNLIPALARLKITYLYIADANYAKILLGTKKVTSYMGIVSKRTYLTHGFQMMYGINYRQAFFNDTAKEKLDFSLNQLNLFLDDKRAALRSNPLIDYVSYNEIVTQCQAYKQLSNVNLLTFDIETYGLDFTECGIATVSFGANQHTARSFVIDAVRTHQEDSKHTKVSNNSHRAALRSFIEEYEGTFIYHNANFDIKILIYCLWMNENPLNYEGMLKGLEVMTRKFHDTKLIAYLALNSTSRTDLGLKELSREFMGNYGIDVADISKEALANVLKYNANDAIATRWVFDKYFPKLVEDEQLEIYQKIFIPSVKVILQIELSGMPMNKEQVKKVSRFLNRKLQRYENFLLMHPTIDKLEDTLREQMAEKANAKLKKLRKTAQDFESHRFNPNSGSQIAILLYSILGYPVKRTTDSGAPASSTKAIKELLQVCADEDKTILRALVGIKELSIIINTFISAFIEKSVEKDDGRIYLHGNFNLGGTVSGRLSSSKPNMQNIPSTGSVYAKLIKSCFVSPPGWIMVGADFSSLEDRISALITKDPEKIKVYTDGYDGHCLRAYSYFGDNMPDINPNSVESINSIAEKYPQQRQDSKAPTFLLTYGGTNFGLVNQCGLDPQTALKIESNYHDLYSVSDEWVAQRIKEASICGYVTVAFGLKVRTPYLKRCVLNTLSTPKEAQAEARTAGNALGQSYGLLNNRAAIEFQERCLLSQYALDIKPIAHIHDSQYFLIRDDLELLQWFNTNLIECMEWQDLPEIAHPNVGLGGQVEVYHPSWANKFTLPNNATKQQIKKILSGVG